MGEDFLAQTWTAAKCPVERRVRPQRVYAAKECLDAQKLYLHLNWIALHLLGPVDCEGMSEDSVAEVLRGPR